MSVTALSGALGLGLVLGLKHALEPDHVAAVSALVAGDGRPARAWCLGAAWGVGHALALVGAAGVVALVGVALPLGLQAGLELAVAAVLVALGLGNVARALAPAAGPPRVHAHAGIAHIHPAVDRHIHVAGVTVATRPLLVGVLHGLAGSGALTAVVLGGSRGAGVAYVLAIAVGSALGMAILAGLCARPMLALAARGRTALAIATGLASAAVGLAWALAPARHLWGL